MNAYEESTIMYTSISQRLIDLMQSFDLKEGADWQLLKLQEEINSFRGLGDSITLSKLLEIVKACYKEYLAIPGYPENSYVEKVAQTVKLVEQYTTKLLGA
jgi:hypothetical protein